MLAGTKFCVFGPIHSNIKRKHEKLVTLRCIAQTDPVQDIYSVTINAYYVQLIIIDEHVHEKCMKSHVYVGIVCMCTSSVFRLYKIGEIQPGLV